MTNDLDYLIDGSFFKDAAVALNNTQKWILNG